MRLWSINPSYLDQKGLVALWREALLAQDVLLKGEYTECSLCKSTGFINAGRISAKCIKCKGTGKLKTPYYNHSQLIRFKQNKDLSLYWITAYLYSILDEGIKRGYKFDRTKIKLAKQSCVCMTVTKGQLEYEFEHLQQKLLKRCWDKAHDNEVMFEGIIKYGNIKANPIFKVIDGNVESWEKIK